MSFKNLIGVQFGQSTVEEYIGRENKETKWLVRCSCGNTYQTTSRYIKLSLKRNNNSSCQTCRTHNFVDLTGVIVGQVTVLNVANKQNGKVRWNVKCSCGNEYTDRKSTRLNSSHNVESL